MIPFVVVQSNCEKECPLCGKERIGGAERFESGLNHIGTYHGLDLKHVGPVGAHVIAAVFAPSKTQQNYNSMEKALEMVSKDEFDPSEFLSTR